MSVKIYLFHLIIYLVLHYNHSYALAKFKKKIPSCHLLSDCFKFFSWVGRERERGHERERENMGERKRQRDGTKEGGKEREEQGEREADILDGEEGQSGQW